MSPARSIKHGQRPAARRGAPVSTREALTGRLRRSLAAAVDRWAERSSQRHAGPDVGLIGLDVAQLPSRLRTGSWMPVLAAMVAGAMFLAVLRMDVIRMRFAVAQAFEEELRLQEEKRELTVRMRQLRDPAVLAQRAEALGFRRAERLIDLGAPVLPARRSVVPRSEPTLDLAAASPRPERRP